MFVYCDICKDPLRHKNFYSCDYDNCENIVCSSCVSFDGCNNCLYCDALKNNKKESYDKYLQIQNYVIQASNYNIEKMKKLFKSK